ncbi:hypothetical protein R70006_06287 [Paraburkholderia domus]|nr:hypothetical protein R70006_06287 [Paraburkholderia domus]
MSLSIRYGVERFLESSEVPVLILPGEVVLPTCGSFALVPLKSRQSHDICLLRIKWANPAIDRRRRGFGLNDAKRQIPREYGLIRVLSDGPFCPHPQRHHRHNFPAPVILDDREAPAIGLAIDQAHPHVGPLYSQRHTAARVYQGEDCAFRERRALIQALTRVEAEPRGGSALISGNVHESLGLLAYVPEGLVELQA